MDKESTITTLTTRRPKWQYPQAAPAPRILHLPRRPRRKPAAKANAARSSSQRERKGKLEALFDQEREFARGVTPIVMLSGGSGGGDDQREEEKRRRRVEERENGLVEEEKWRFQAEMLRAECNLLRMERKIAVKKMERRRVQMERTLRSAIQTLLSGRQMILEGNNVSIVLEEEIHVLAEKLGKLQRRPRVTDLLVKKCSNFDKQAYLLERRLGNFGAESDEKCLREIQEMAEASLSMTSTCSVSDNSASYLSCNMEILRKKMEGLAKGTLSQRMEDEYMLILSTANNSAANSASSSKRLELRDMSISCTRQPCKVRRPQEGRTCSGCCKAIARRVIEQVRAETEQWSQMQEMLGQVREEMEELQASRDFWEDRALDSDYEMQSLRSAVQEWRHKALSFEAKASELQAQVSALRAELEKLRKKKATETAVLKNLPALSQDASSEMEKRVLVCQFRENHHAHEEGYKLKKTFHDGRRKPLASTREHNAAKRSPLEDIGNSLPLARLNSKAVFPLRCPLPSNTQENISNCQSDCMQDFSILRERRQKAENFTDENDDGINIFSLKS